MGAIFLMTVSDATIHRLQEQLAFLERNVDNRVEVSLQ